MSSNYQTIKNSELRSHHDEFSFSKQMQIASRNSLWRNKEALWTVLSGACDDAAKECYIKINNMVSEIADIETCNIHALKSIAKSVDAEFLTKDIKENYDSDILNLINMFSVQKEILLNTNVYLHDTVIDKTFGYLTLKSLDIHKKNVSIDLILMIKSNVNSLKHIFETNLIPLRFQLIDLLKYDLDDLKLSDLEGSYEFKKLIDSVESPIISSENDILKLLTLNDILNSIEKIKNDENLSIYREQKLYVDGKINYYYLLINIIKQNYFNNNKKIYMLTSYFDNDKNQDIDCSKLIFNIVGTIFTDDEIYLNEYVGYHFFNTLHNKIVNDKLKSNYIFDKRLNTFVFNQEVRSEMSKDEFIAYLTSYISYDDAINFISVNKITKFRYEFIDFVKECSKLNKELKIKNNYKNFDESPFEGIELNILKINYPTYFKEDGEKIIEKLYGETGILYHFTKLYVDECIHIRNIRNQLRDLIQQYTFIGTKRIATDIFYDFFINNFSNRQSLNYLSNDLNLSGDNGIYNFNEVKRHISDLINGQPVFKDGELIKNEFEDNKFSVNVIEYYDSTQYLNIESELPISYNESVATSYEEVLSSYLDENYLITTTYVKKPVYTTSYAPCSLYIKNYNEKFWQNKNVFLNSQTNILESNAEDYIKYYSTYIPEMGELSLDTFKEDYITNVLYPMLDNIWDTFALSAMNSEDLNSDIGELYKEYIGTSIGNNRFINHLNKTFPTIAPINSIENLIESSELDDTLLFLAKNYYGNVLSKIKEATISILKMYNEDSIPHEGWRQTYITFNGYSTVYEYSNNKLLYSIKTSELYKNNGPFVYRKFQEFLYNHYLSGQINLNNFLNEYSASDEIKRFYEFYLNGDGKSIFFDTDDSLIEYHISKYEEDIFENCFTLFKDKNEIAGKLFYRSYNMPISIPLMDINSNFNILSVSNLKYEKILEEISNNCIDYGFLNEMMWIFGKNGDSYNLVSFKYTLKNGMMIINASTFINHTLSSNLNGLNSLNDFVGVFYDDKKINFILFDCISTLTELSLKYQEELNSDTFSIDFKHELLSNFNLTFFITTLDEETLDITKRELKNKNLPLPMFLKHNESLLSIKNDEHIWKLMVKNDKCFITYKSLNKNINDNTFDYYFEYNTLTIKVHSIFVNWNVDFNYVDINNVSNKMIFENNNITNNIILRNDGMRDLHAQNKQMIQNIESFKNQLLNDEFNTCFIKNNRIYSKMLVTNIGIEFTNSFFDFLLSIIINRAEEWYVYNDAPYELTFEEMLNILNSSDVINWTNNYNWLKSTPFNSAYTFNDLRDAYEKIISIKNEMINGIYKISDDSSLSNIYNKTNIYYKSFPILKDCCINPLEVSFVFLNNGNVTFLNKGAFDLDITCYIDDEVEKFRKVGYGNPYNKTNYINWSGDTRDGGVEKISVDISKYIKNKFKNGLTNTYVNIIFNVCWYESSELTTNDVYALVSWNNLIEKYPVKLYGTNSLRCDTKSFEIRINMASNELTFDDAKLYSVVCVNYKEKLKGFDDIADIELGTMNLSNRDFDKILQNGWNRYLDTMLYYYKVNDSKYYYLIKDDNYSIIKNSNDDLITLYKRLLSELIYYKENGIVLGVLDVSLDSIFFGWNTDVNEHGVNLNYMVYLNPKYFKNTKNMKYKVNYLLHSEIGELSFKLVEGN